MWTLNFIYHALDFIYHFLKSLSLLSYLVYTFMDQAVLQISCLESQQFCRAFNYTKIVPNVYICQVWLSYVTCQNFYYLANTLANNNSLLVLDLYHLVSILINSNDIPKIYFCHLANVLTNTNNISKMDLCHLANALTNTDDKDNDFIIEKLVASN